MKKTLTQAGYSSENASSIYMGLKVGLALGLPIIASPFYCGSNSASPFSRAPLFGDVTGLPDAFPGPGATGGPAQKRDPGEPPRRPGFDGGLHGSRPGANAAIKRVGDDLKFSNPILAQEMLKLNLEISAGQEREQALRNLGERTGVDEVISLCNILIQSDRFGTSIANTLKVQSDAVRTARRQKLETLAAKTPVKLVFPLLFFIFPAIMVVSWAPR